MALSIKPPRLPDEMDSKDSAVQQVVSTMPTEFEGKIVAKLEKRYEDEEKLYKGRLDELEKKDDALKLKEEAYEREQEEVAISRKKLEFEIEERRKHVRLLENELEEKQELLFAKEKTLAQKEHLLKGLETDAIVKLKNEISALRKKKDELEVHIQGSALSQEFARDDNSALKNALSLKEQLLSKKELMLNEYEKRLHEKDQEIKNFSQNLEEQQAGWAKKLSEHEAQVHAFVEERKAVNSDILAHMEQLNASHATVEEKASQLELVKKDLERKEKDLEEQESMQDELDALLKQKEDILNSKEFLVRDKALELEHREEDAKKLLEQVDQRQKLLQQHAQILVDKREMLDKELPFSLEKLGKIREEWQVKEYLLKERGQRVLQDKVATEEILSKIEANVKILSEKEKSIVAKVKDLEKDKVLLEKEEQGLLEKVAKLELANAALAKREKELKEIEQTISEDERIIKLGMDKVTKTQEITEDLPKLKRQHEELRRQTKKIEDDILGKQSLLKAQEEKLRQRELDLEARDLMLKQKESALVNEEYELIHAKGEPSILKEMVVAHLQPVVGEPIAAEHLDYGNVYSLIDRAKDCINTHQLGEARVAIEHIEREMQSLEESAKRRVSYELMDLKTDIKLAAL